VCGIAATLLEPQERPPEFWQAIRQNFTQNLLFNEQRGQEATGLAVLQADGQAQVAKLPLPAHEFVETAVYHNLLAAVGPQTTLILGHTRFPTKGDPAFPGNNHPIQVGAVLGVHNGRIHNDDALFAQCNCPRQAQVDSEIIFQLLALHSSTQDDYLQTIRPAIQQLEGEFTFLAGDRRTAARLLVVRHRNPLSVHYHASWQALIFSSRYVFLRKIFGRAVLAESVPRDHLMLFDSTMLKQSKHNPIATLPLAENGERHG
jgi:glucosamine 6-phosphate synthetase-like amidotransferase/phosphosugar isomerase protein